MANPTMPSRPTSTVSTAEADTSKPSVSSASSSTSRLMPTLSRLSLSTSRPQTLLPRADDVETDLGPAGYKSKTIRFVSRGGKEVFRRSGLAGLFPASSGLNAPSTPTGPSKAKSRSTLGLDTSKVLYPTLQQHPAPEPHPVLVVSLAQIGGISPMINNDELFDTLLRKLEPWVGEEGEGGYVLVVLAADNGRSHEGARKWPGVGWWVWKWKRIPRKYRKNMKRLYIVHPSLFTRTLLPFLLPLLSPKSYGKLHPLSSLLALSHTYGVPLTGIDITLPVLQEEASSLRDRPDLRPSRCRSGYQRPKMEARVSWTGTISSSISYATSYLPFSQYLTDTNEKTSIATGPSGLWGRKAEEILQDNDGKLPRALIGLRDAILTHCTSTEGVFRRTSNSDLLGPITALLDLPIADQPNLPWNDIAMDDPLVPPKIILRFIAELAEPLIPESMYTSVRQTGSTDHLQQRFIPSLPASSQTILTFVVRIMADLAKFETATKMTPLAFAIVLAPALIDGSDPLEDAQLCMEPGRRLPKGLGRKNNTNESKPGGDGTLVGLLRMWIEAKQAVAA